MTHILIPRSDSISAKTVEPTDWAKYFDNTVINSYIVNGFVVTESAGCNRSVDVSSGVLRLDGYYVENSACETTAYTFGTDCTHYLYVTFCLDGSCQPEAWGYTSNTTGVTAANSFHIATVVTAGGDVSTVDQCELTTQINTESGTKTRFVFGDGFDGDCLTASGTLTEVKYFKNLTVTGNLTTNFQPGIIYVQCTLTICTSGTIEVNGDGSAGGSGGSTAGGSGGPSVQEPGVGIAGQAGTNGNAGQAGTAGTGGGAAGAGGLNSPGAGGSGGSGGGASPGGAGGGPGPGPGGNPGGAGATGTATRLIHSLFDFLGQDCRPTIAGAGGGGGGSSGSGGGGGSGQAGSSPNPTHISGKGGNGGASSGGAGGAGGGMIVLIARHINIKSGGKITANGVNGGSGGTAGNGQSGQPFASQSPQPPTNFGSGGGGGGAGGGAAGGGGGGGGTMMLIYETLVNNGTLTSNGGSGGAGAPASGGNAGSGGPSPGPAPPTRSGQAGNVGGASPGSGATGSAGSAGQTIHFKM